MVQRANCRNADYRAVGEWAVLLVTTRRERIAATAQIFAQV
jgi:hypothetical protein